ncbi:MAG TPA: beta-galactosidase trimerization domain-containing protein [Lacipirellulaceae bacterium]
MDHSPLLFSRRQVLAGAAAAAATTFVPSFSAISLGATSASVPKALNRARRWVQLALVEQDPATFDPDWWLDFFKRVHAEGACISAGGVCAYYPTEVPFHHRSDALGDKDVLGYLVEGCRKQNMAVIARVDPHCIRDDAAQAHPEWVAVDANGQKARHMVMSDRWLTCALGPYNFEFMPQVLREIAAKYNVDAFFANRWAGHIDCYCESCRAEFKKATGLVIPPVRHGANWVEFERWRTARLFQVWDVWDAAVHEVNPDIACLMNKGGAHEREMTQIGQRAGMVAADRQGRSSSVVPPWMAGWNAKVFRSVMDEKPVAGITSVGSDDAHRWKDSVQSAAELRVWMLETIAHGMRPWVVKFCGTLYDRRWIPVVEEIFKWHAANAQHLDYRRNLARVAIVWSPQTSAAVGNANTEASQMGIYHALIEARTPCEMVYEQLLDAEHLDRFRLLILPNVAALSDAQCAQLRQFVGRGGSLVATFETSLYDEAGKKRSDFALADLFGVSYSGKTDAFVKNAYINIEHDTRHPILHGFDDAGRMINTVGYVDVKPTAPFRPPPLTRVPSYPDLPMEDVYPRQAKTDIAEVYLREVGNGRVAYFPGDIDRTFWEVLDPDHGRLIANVVRWTLDELDVISVSGPGVLDVGVWQQDDSLSAHLVNLTNPMMMKGPLRELYPVSPQQVTLRIPSGRAPRDVRLLVSKADAKPKVDDQTLSLTIPSITDHEVVAVSF